MKIYRHENKILALHHKDADWKKGLDFLTSDDLFIQAGTWWYDQGKILDSHIHNTFERITNITQEVVYVKRGAMKAFLFNERKEFVCDFLLEKGDTAIFVHGGHGYEILEDDTQILEVKNGPFFGVEKDKTKFNPV